MCAYHGLYTLEQYFLFADRLLRLMSKGISARHAQYEGVLTHWRSNGELAFI